MTSKKITNIHSSHLDAQRIKIVHGLQNIIKSQSQLFENTKIKVDNCINYDNLTSSISLVELESIKESIIEAKKRGLTIRYITEIREDNIEYCKELYLIVDELRHLDRLKSNFILSESEYISHIGYYSLNEKRGKKIISEIIYSNIKSFIKEQQHIFNILWNKAIPAENKIKEIENSYIVLKIENRENPAKQKILEEEGKGLEINYEAKIIKKPNEIINRIIHLAETSSQLLIVSSYGGMQLIYNNFFDHYKKILDEYKTGESKGIKWICNIEKENLEIAKIFLKMGMQIHHIKNLPPINFALGDKEINATIEEMEKGKMVQSLLTSNEPLYIRHFLSVFENLWYSSMNATDRIAELEQDIESEGIEIIRNPFEVQQLSFNLLKSTKDEILIIFSTANAFHRQEKAGLIKFLTEIASEKGNNVNIKIMTPVDNKLQDTKRELENIQTDEEIEEKDTKLEYGKEEKNIQPNSKKIHIKFIESQLQTTISLLIVDRKYSLAIELKDDTKDTTYEAIGLATYSNSKSTVLSYVSMFETLWLQTELFDLLKIKDKIQKDFINIAAHELRTPIQPILGMSDILYSRIEDNEQKMLLESIIRNAKRLKRLTNDILDVAKIETGSFKIKKERFNLDELITNLIAQYKTSTKEIDTNNSNLVYLAENRNFIIDGDKEKIYQVLDNLLCNAFKFTKGLQCADITIKTKKHDYNNVIIVSVKDTGTGIDKEILPKLFTKFATKSEAGTGLGLYISKNIIKAHDGTIWAENNLDGKGAIFRFTLPIEP
ncbi:MAG TPA: HAMP domain-containing sensor histidine kinase [Nitrososphaeraceae archaeon]